MEGMLELSEQKLKTTMVNMLRDLIEKVDNMQKKMRHVSRETEILKKNKKEMPETKNAITEIKNASDGLITRQDMTEERSLSPKLKSKEEK